MIEKVTVVRHTNMRVNERTFRVTEKKKKKEHKVQATKIKKYITTTIGYTLSRYQIKPLH